MCRLGFADWRVDNLASVLQCLGMMGYWHVRIPVSLLPLLAVVEAVMQLTIA
ncbi:MAG: hypothetical protein FWD57_02515 [Polyangiaceae bacterium]|nr:hypothetical protein [Polyangiaceae bacterium]